jgi:uncharacterized protein YndB with AHSA1/START domain
MEADRIEKKILLAAPRGRVWRAVSEAERFGYWFGAVFDGPFVAGARLRARITPTRVDPQVALMQAPYAGATFDFLVERIEAPSCIAFGWHPFAVLPGIDYDSEPPTQIVFALEEAPGGTQLTITESGFERLPQQRRMAAYAANDGGWAMQTRLIEKYLALDGDEKPAT